MTENMKKLLELASTNPKLQEKLNNATKETLIALAKEQGITLTDADFAAPQGEISDDELDAVAGGKYCYCAAGGGGTGESSTNTKTCACVINGGGRTKTGQTRCACVMAGYGENGKLV